MRDVDHAHAARLQFRNDPEDFLGLALREGRGRLVEDEATGTMPDGATDLDELFAGRAQLADLGLRS